MVTVMLFLVMNPPLTLSSTTLGVEAAMARMEPVLGGRIASNCYRTYMCRKQKGQALLV